MFASKSTAGRRPGGSGAGSGISDTTMRNAMIGVLLIYALAQTTFLLLGGPGGPSVPVPRSKRGAAGPGGPVAAVNAPAVPPAPLSSSSSSSSSSSTTASVRAASVSGSGEERPFAYDAVEELPFPPMAVDDGGVPIYDVLPRARIETADARQVLLDARKKEDKDKGGKYDSTPVTVGVPCWTDHRILWRMGLDRQADDMEAGRIPQDGRRSRSPHGFADIASDLMCTFHSTPISGGLQCCCQSNRSIPYYSSSGGGEVTGSSGGGSGVANAPSPGTFFCLPSTIIAGARSTGAGLLAAFFQQHAYLQTGRAAPPHAMAATTSLYVVDTVIPRYLAHYAQPQLLPEGFLAMPRETRGKSISPVFWIDPSPSYFYGIHSPILLRKLLPRSKVLVMLREPIERAYVDLVASIARQARKPAEAALLRAVHACMKQAACAEGGDAAAHRGARGLTPSVWAAGAGGRFEQCLLTSVSSNAEIQAVEGVAQPASLVSCVSRATRPGGALDWQQLYARHAATNPAGEAGVLACGAGDASSALAAEADAVWGRALHSLRHQAVGCLDGPDTATGPPFAPPADVMLAAVAAAEKRLTACSLAVPPGTAIPVPVDLLAANINGYELGLYAVAGELPKDADGEGRILLDGDRDGCFPDGVDVDDPAAPLARSLYLRPLQRLHAAYGRKYIQIYDTAVLRSDPAAVMDPIFESLSVYKPTLDPVQGRSDCKLMGWVGEAGECDVRVPVMEERVRAELQRVLAPYIRAFKAYVATSEKESSGDGKEE